jgi:hypothetical protein
MSHTFYCNKSWLLMFVSSFPAAKVVFSPIRSLCRILTKLFIIQSWVAIFHHLIMLCLPYFCKFCSICYHSWMNPDPYICWCYMTIYCVFSDYTQYFPTLWLFPWNSCYSECYVLYMKIAESFLCLPAVRCYPAWFWSISCQSTTYQWQQHVSIHQSDSTPLSIYMHYW